jgi:hypothetical protein
MNVDLIVKSEEKYLPVGGLVRGKVELYLRKLSNQIGYVIGYGLEFSRR